MGFLLRTDFMVRYRIYTVGHDGHFTGPPAEVEAADDREILVAAEKQSKGFAVEIWDHKRFVARIPPRRKVLLAQMLRDVRPSNSRSGNLLPLADREPIGRTQIINTKIPK